MGKRIVALLIGLAAAATFVPAAWAKGAAPEKLPVPQASVGAAAAGVAVPGGRTRYVARRAGERTVVKRLRGKRVIDSTRLSGAFVVPAVTLGGQPGGLSADGSTLTLVAAGRTFPRTATSLAILDARRLQLRRYVRLPGDFSFDAISPTGSRLYLIDYTSRTDATEYAVRALDVGSGRLLRRPIVDPSERNSDEMGGYPVARVASPGARWAYTLYSAPGRRPFVHALDTVHGRAVCVDLPGVAAGDLRTGHLSLNSGDGRLTVNDDDGSAVAVVDTGTLKASAPQRHSPAPVDAGASGLPWLPIGLGVGLMLAVVSLWGMPRMHRRRLADGGG